MKCREEIARNNIGVNKIYTLSYSEKCDEPSRSTQQ
jgi:hypothetical protein